MKRIPFLFITILVVCGNTEVLAQTASPSDNLYSQSSDIDEEQARERETQASEDPLAQHEARKVDTPVEHANRKNSLGAYASLRLRYRSLGDEASLDDGGSRVGANADWQLAPDYWLNGRVEAGFNLLNELGGFLNPGANSSDGESGLFLRLLYMNLETPDFFLVLGKAWSTYYKVAGFTDRFAGTGGSASGAFNAGTDGGPSGTGRADNVLQSRIHIKPGRYLGAVLKPFTLNVQVQKNQPLPFVFDFTDDGGIREIKYGYAAGLSALLETRDDLTIGLAYNLAQIADKDKTALSNIGIDGDDRAFLIGTKWFNEKWYLATNISWLWNHMTTEDGIYFDGRGWETYGQYNVHKRWWVTAGWNYLKPYDSQQQAGSYRVKYGVLGVRYSISKFNRMLFANVRFDGSTASEVEEEGISNTYTVGVRWNFPR